jgi:hypothetical protein
VPEVAAGPGHVRTREAAAATEATAHMAAAEATAHMAAAEATAHMAAAEATAHMAAAAEPATVSTATAPATARKRVSGQSPSESGSHSQNDHGLA